VGVRNKHGGQERQPQVFDCAVPLSSAADQWLAAKPNGTAYQQGAARASKVSNQKVPFFRVFL
jgi:hypothetical protein